MAFYHSIILSFYHSIILSFNHSIIQSFNQPSNQAIIQSTKQPSNHSIKQRYHVFITIFITFTKTDLKIPYFLLFPLSLTRAAFLNHLIP
ncbi:hypothetical protein [Helicobacter pylori]|uniref:hypothetical protein n=1 Tax=Helicobacter pylori TaxID=210 RepID=UPI000C2FFAB3|nr:hypothetical protein [Helicobacter pylori]